MSYALTMIVLQEVLILELIELTEPSNLNTSGLKCTKMWQTMCDHVMLASVPRKIPIFQKHLWSTCQLKTRLHMDILGPLTPSAKGHRYILLVVDSFSKFPEAFPLKTQESKEIADVLFSEIFTRYGAPRVIVSDRGQNFLSKLVTAVCEIFQVTRHFNSSYHPQTNSTCERMNSTIAQCLRTYINPEQTNWHKLLPGVMMFYIW